MALVRGKAAAGDSAQPSRLRRLSCLLVLAATLQACSQPTVSPPETTLNLPHTANVRKFEFSSNGKWLLTAGGDNRVIQWDARSGRLIRSFAARDFELAAGGQGILIMARDGGRDIPTLISLESGSVLRRVRVPFPRAVRLNASLSRDGRYLLVIWGSASWQYAPAEMAVWDMQTNTPLWDPGMPLPFTEEAEEWQSDFYGNHPSATERLRNDRKSVLFRRHVRPDGKVLATQTPLAYMSVAVDNRTMLVRHWDDTGSATDESTFWDIESATPLQHYNEPFDDLRPHLYGPNREWFLRGKFARSLELCDARSGELLQRFNGHEANITAIVLSPDGKTIVSGDDDGVVIVWDRATSTVHHQLEDLSSEGIRSLAFRADGKKFLVAAEEQRFIELDTVTGSRSQAIRPPGHSNRRLQVRYSPAGDRIFSMDVHGSYREINTHLWDAGSGKRIASCSLPQLETSRVSPDGEFALAWSVGDRRGRQNLALWKLPEEQPTHSFLQHLSDYRHQFWDQRDFELTTPAGVTVHRWTKQHYYERQAFRIGLPRESRTLLARLPGLSDSTKDWLESFILPVSQVWPRDSTRNGRRVISPDGRLGAQWMRRPKQDAEIQLLNIASGEVIRHVVVPANEPTAVAFSPGAQQLLVAFMSADKLATVTAWNTDNGDQLWAENDVFGKQHVGVEHFYFAPNSSSLAVTSSFQRETAVLDGKTGASRFRSKGKVSFRADGQRVILRGDEDALWDVAEGKKLHLFGTHEPTDAFIFSPNGRFLWHSKYVTYSLYSAETGELVCKTGVPISAFGDQQSWHVGSRFGRHGTRFVTRRGDLGREARLKSALWDFDKGEKVCDLLLPDGSSIENATFTPDGRRLVTLFYDELEFQTGFGQPAMRTRLVCWDASSGEQLLLGEAEPGTVEWQASKLQFTSGGTKCLSVHLDGIMLWNLGTARVEHHFPQPGLAVAKVLVAPGGRQMLAILPATGATLWDLETGEKIRQFGALPICGPLSGSVWTEDAHFTVDGRQLVTRSHNGRAIHLIDLDSGKRQWSFFQQGDGSRAMTIVNEN